MFGRKKDAAKISDKTPVFHVRYIGNTETFVANGKGCSYAPVQRLWDNSPGEKHLRKVAVHINPAGISLREAERGSQGDPELARDFRIEDISFCNTDRAVNERIFSWICRHQGEGRLDCHAVLCSSKQKAQTMAVVLSRAFQIAYKDWRARNRGRLGTRSASKPPGVLSESGPRANGGEAAAKDLRPNGSEASGSSPSPPPFSSVASASSPSTGKGSNAVASSSVVASTLPGSTSSQVATSQQKATSQKSTHFSDKVTVMSDNGTSNPLTSSVYEHPSTSSGFMGSSILDPDLEDAIRGVDCLHADFDLEDDDSD